MPGKHTILLINQEENGNLINEGKMNKVNIDLCIVSLTKHKENELFVWYKFKFNIETGTYLSKSKNIRYKFEPRCGIIKISKNIFNKNTNDSQKQIVEIVEKETDPIFFKVSQKDVKYIIYTCLSATIT